MVIKNTTYQNLWYAANAVLRGKIVILNAYTRKKQKKYKIKDLSFQLQKVKNRSKLNPKRYKIISKDKSKVRYIIK